jgi:hypothetical protein
MRGGVFTPKMKSIYPGTDSPTGILPVFDNGLKSRIQVFISDYTFNSFGKALMYSDGFNAWVYP